MVLDNVDAHALLSRLVADEELMAFRVDLEPLTLSAGVSGPTLAHNAQSLCFAVWPGLLVLLGRRRPNSLVVGMKDCLILNTKRIGSSKGSRISLAHVPLFKGVVNQLLCKLRKVTLGRGKAIILGSSDTFQEEVGVNNTHTKNGHCNTPPPKDGLDLALKGKRCLSEPVVLINPSTGTVVCLASLWLLHHDFHVDWWSVEGCAIRLSPSPSKAWISRSQGRASGDEVPPVTIDPTLSHQGHSSVGIP
jgi:hypothetical protein